MKFKKVISLAISIVMGISVLPTANIFAEENYNNAQGQWKFDFGSSDNVEDGYIGVSADTKFTDSLEYGFIGIGERDYKFNAGSLMDSFNTIQGQQIELVNGTGSGTGANSDFVAAVCGSAVTEPNDFYDYTTENPIRFSMTAENGGYYNVKVTLANSSQSEAAKISLFAERRHQLLTDVEIPAGENLEYSFNVDVETVYFKSINGNYKDDSISIEVTGKNAAIASMEVTKLENGTTLWLMGDSTGCDQGCGFPYFPLQNYAGTGQGLTKYLPENIALSNQGDGGINSGDNSHYNNVKLKQGDYLYAEWGHNETGTDAYVKNMERYYRDCVKAGANLIVVGPIDRSGTGQFNSSTGKWSSTLGHYSEAGKTFVNKILTDTSYVQSILGDDYSGYTADELNNIAFVDINAGWIEFLNSATERYKNIMNKDTYDFQSVKFYYKADKTGLVENSHENDAGADNAAYIFFAEAQKTVEVGQAADATDAQKAQAAVLKGITENMRDNTPCIVSETILNGGDVINKNLSNVYYPATVTETYEGYPATVKKVNITDNKITSVDVKMEHNTGLTAQGITYALAVAEVNGIQTSSTLATKYDVTNGNGKFTLLFENPIELTESGEYTVWLQGLDDDTQAVKQGEEYRFSEKFTQNDVSDIDEYLMGDYDDIEIPDTFSYFGVKTGSSINSQNGWRLEGSASYTTTLENDGEKTYMQIANTGCKDNGSGGTYYLYKPFSSSVKDGKIVFDTDIYYESGVLNFYYSESGRKMEDTASVKCFEVNNSILTSNGETFNITPNAWTHIVYSLDYDNGTAEMTVGSETKSYTIEKLNTCLADGYNPKTLGSFCISGVSKQEANFKFANLSVKKLISKNLEDKTVSVSASEGGDVKIQGYDTKAVTVPMNSTLTIEAIPNDGYKFINWLDADGKMLFSDLQVNIRVHKDLSLTAVFEEGEAEYDYKPYSCDFTRLVKNGADTTYGTASDIVKIDSYTTAYLTYEGSYVSADGKVYLKSGTITNKAGLYKRGSYIAFTAPADGKVTITGADLGVCKGDETTDTYEGIGKTASTYEIEKGQMLFFGWRKDSTYISALNFTPNEPPAETTAPTDKPSETPSVEPEREVIYSENFESYNIGDNGGWTSPAGTMGIKSDSTSGIEKYQTVVSGKSGTCRSGYVELANAIDQNFVFECDFKSNSNVNVSDLELLENKSSIYANHGKYSNAKYAFTMARPKNSNLYVINNATDDSGLTLDSYTQPAVTTKEIANNPWLHIKVIGNFDNHTAIAYITSLDGKTTYYHGMTDMSTDITSWKCIHLLSPSTGADTCIDNIKISKALSSDLAEKFHTVKINDGISEFSQYVFSGESAVNIPDMSIYGAAFEGWNVNGETKSNDELKSLPITEDTTITAKISDNYIENIESVEFNNFPTDNLLVMGADGDTYADNNISLTITGERGTSIVATPDSRVTDYKIEWTFDGFRTMGGKPTGETGFIYCDSYGLCEITDKAQTAVNFKLKNTAENYYGRVTAKVTYNNKTLSISKPLLLLSDTSRDEAVIIPKTGYTADYNKYDSALVGYKASKDDVLTGGWSTDGSDVSHITLNSDSTGKHLSLTRDLSGNSSYIYNTIGNITSQTVFSQDVRFGMDASIEYGADTAKGTVTAFNSTAFTLSLSDSAITLNGSPVCNGEKNKWYHIEITADPTTKLCFAKVYNLNSDGDYSDETPIAKTQTVNFKDGYTTGAYYRITLEKDKNNSVDINNVEVTTAQTDESSINITAPETVTIPSSGTNTTEISVSAKVVGGDDAIGMASWEIADETAAGVSIASKDAKSATLTIDSAASAGELPIRVTINGTSAIKKIKLIGTQNNIAFTSSPTGAMIPASGSANYTYTAEVRNGNGDKIDGTVSYSLYNADNTAELNAAGISISNSGVLTITSSASPQTIYVRATLGDLTKSVKVSVYGLKFDFGTNTPANGYTSVTSQTLYSENLGYGITGTATDNADKLSGSDFGFKVKLEKGEVYKVIAKYKGTIKCEKIDSSLSGFERTKSALEADTYNTAVFGDGVLDITLSGAGELDSISIEKVERTANAKPAWWTIGDSTVQQNGSWAYTLNNTLSTYTKLNNTISAFYNSGQAGRQHKSYYSEGLLNNVLCGIKPGDVVSISGMGTNDSGSTKEQFKAYNNAYIDAVEDMGAYVILGSYTPTGNYGATQGKVYDSDNVLFKGIRTNAYDTAIREIYAERKNDDKILGFIDIGQIADNLMTNNVRTAYNTAADNGKTAAEARAAANEKATELMAMWKDYNHYYTDFSNYILPEITNRAAQLILGEAQDAVPAVIDLKSVSSTPTTAPTASPTVPPAKENNIKILEKSMTDKNIVIKIDKDFDGTAIAAMYDNNAVLKQILTETDSSKTRDFSFIKPDNITGYTIKLMSWDSLNGMKPIDRVQTITVSDITVNQPTPDPSVNSSIEVISSEEYIDVSSLKMYDNNTYRMYNVDGSYETVTAQNGKVHNTTGTKVTVVPEYKFDFTQDGHIDGYVKVGANSYTEEKGYGLLSGVDYSINGNGCRPVDGRPIKVDVPAGFYDITVYRVGGVRADVYSEGVQIINNTTSNGSQNRPSESAVMYAPSVNIEKGADITFGNIQGNSERIASIEIVRVPEQYRKPVIWVAGDSESANYYPIDANGSDLDSNKIMMTGFGMQLGKFLSDKYRVANWGQPSATAGTWNSECLEAISKRMQKGDTILIDFGINDAISSSNKVDVDTAKANIKAIVDAAKAAETTPILISPVYNSKYQHRTYFTYNKASDSNILSDFAKELEAEFIDLNKYTMLYTDEAIAQTGDENWITNNYHVGDNLHMTQHSALLDASFICAQMKKMGYETTDFAYTYKDISSIGDNFTRGTESGVTRVYSIAEAEKFIAANAAPEEVYSKVWNFETNQTASSGSNIPVISGNASWSEANQNIKFDVNDKTASELKVMLDPAAEGDIIKTAFDLNLGSLSTVNFGYDITDSEGTRLIDCKIDVYNSKLTLNIANKVVADNESVGISKISGDGMSAATTQIINEIDFTTNTVKVTIGSSTFTEKLTGAETKTVSEVEIQLTRSSGSNNTNRHTYLDNLSVKAYKSANSGGETETAFPAFEKKVYTAQDGTELPYRIRVPENVSENIPVLVYLHGETRKGNDNESQLYNAQYMFDEIEKSETDCILVAPQCPSGSVWTDMSDIVSELAQSIENADSDRIYIAGYGEGANACYDLLETGAFAAAVPISGTGDMSKAQAIADTNAAVMAFNGSEETENARDMIKALITAGAKNAEYSEIYGESSNIQDKAAQSGVVEWLMSKNKTANSLEEIKNVDLAIFMGQSNMAGRGEYEDAVFCPVGHGYEFRSVTEPDMLFNITGPFGKLENNTAVNDNSGAGEDRRSGDMVSALMESYYNQTGTPIVGVQCSRGGTNLGYWNGMAVRNEAQSRLTAAKTYLEENGYEIGHIFMVWVQGEADGDKLQTGSQSIDGYKNSTLAVFDYMKEVGITDMFIVQTGHYNGDDADGTHDAAYVAIHDAQGALAQENENVYAVGSLLEYQSSMKDQYHFHQDAYNEVGTTAGNAIAQIYAQ